MRNAKDDKEGAGSGAPVCYPPGSLEGPVAVYPIRRPGRPPQAGGLPHRTLRQLQNVRYFPPSMIRNKYSASSRAW